MITNHCIIYSFLSILQIPTVRQLRFIFDDNYFFFILFISLLGNSNEHHKLTFYGELTNYVFWLS